MYQTNQLMHSNDVDEVDDHFNCSLKAAQIPPPQPPTIPRRNR